MKILAYIFAFAFFLPFTAAAQDVLTLDAENAIKLEELLRDGDKLRSQVETLQAKAKEQDREIKELREGLAAAKRQEAATLEERIRQDERAKLQAEKDAFYKAALAELKEALKEAREEIREQRKAAARERLLGAIPLVGVLLLLFAGVGP